MSQLEGVQDLSEYVRRTNKVPIYNTVTLVMGTQSIAVSGIVLAQQSEALRELVMAHSEVRPYLVMAHSEVRPYLVMAHSEVRPYLVTSHIEVRPYLVMTRGGGGEDC